MDEEETREEKATEPAPDLLHLEVCAELQGIERLVSESEPEPLINFEAENAELKRALESAQAQLSLEREKIKAFEDRASSMKFHSSFL